MCFLFFTLFTDLVQAQLFFLVICNKLNNIQINDAIFACLLSYLVLIIY